MSLILLVAMLLGGGVLAGRLAKRAAAYRRTSEEHATLEQCYRTMIRIEEGSIQSGKRNLISAANMLLSLRTPHPFGDREGSRETLRALWNSIGCDAILEIEESTRRLEEYRAIAAHQAMLRAKYRRAASHPWEMVPPDPPAPSPSLRRSPPLLKPAPPAQPKRNPDPKRFLTAVLHASASI
jgi:hypothetical protein